MKGFYCYVTVITCLACLSQSACGIQTPLQGYSEEVVVACRPGTAPGQYVYHFGGGYKLAPVCFAIDPNDGCFLIPQTDTKGDIRINKFSSAGVFLKMIMLEPGRRVSTVYGITIGDNSDIWLIIGAPGCIAQYDSEGHLIRVIGSRGIITPEEIEADKKKPYIYYDDPLLDKYFRYGLSFLYKPTGDHIWLGDYHEGKKLYDRCINIVSGKLVKRIVDPEEQPEKIKEKLKKTTTIVGRLKEYDKLKHPEIIFPAYETSKKVIGADGHLYYMYVDSKVLEIRKVIFD